MAILFGDTTGSLRRKQHGGDQTLIGADAENTLYGDAGLDLLDSAQGGNDTLITYASGNLYGDAGGNIVDHAKGGNDTLGAQIATTSTFSGPIDLNMYGDAGGSISDHGIDGNDVIVAGITGGDLFFPSMIGLYGDAGGNISGHGIGGNDVISGTTDFADGIATTLNIYGDVGGNICDYARGGNDIIKGDLSRSQYLYGDAGGDLSGHATGGNDQIIVGGTPSGNSYAYGDAGVNITAYARGGNDILDGSHAAFVFLYGDAGADMSGHAIGGNDQLIGGADGSTLMGDAGGNMTDHARGGNDILVANGGDVAPLFMFGDAQKGMFDNAIGGNDVLTVTGISPLPEALYGDAETMSGNARGGDDVLQTDGDILSGSNGAVLYGDGYSMSDNARGGVDRVIGGIAGTSDTLIGDAYEMHGNARAGNDVLISRGADDQMWGDAIVMDATVSRGHNTFVFAPMNGQDTINDFHSGLDHIDLTVDAAIGLHQFADLNIQTVGADSVIHIDASNDITVIGVSHLNAGDFVFDGPAANNCTKPASIDEKRQLVGAYDDSSEIHGSFATPTGAGNTSLALFGQYAAAGFQCEANAGGSLFTTSQQVASPSDEQVLAQSHR